MGSFLALIVFVFVAGPVVTLPARAEVSCGSCGGSSPQEKVCGTLRKDLKYAESQVELCLDLESGGVACGVSADPLLLLSINTMKALQVEELCFKFDTSTSPRRITSVQSRQL